MDSTAPGLPGAIYFYLPQLLEGDPPHPRQRAHIKSLARRRLRRLQGLWSHSNRAVHKASHLLDLVLGIVIPVPMPAVQRHAYAAQARPTGLEPCGEECGKESKQSEMYRKSRAQALCQASAVGYREIVNVKSKGIYGICGQFRECMQVCGVQAGSQSRELGSCYM